MFLIIITDTIIEMNYNNIPQKERDELLKKQLSLKIVKILERYRLISTPDSKWISEKENSHEQIIFTQKFLLKTDEIGAMFRANYLCYAKFAYFRENTEYFEPAKYDPFKGFLESEISDSDFLKHKISGIYIEYRFLQRMTDISKFREFCSELEMM